MTSNRPSSSRAKKIDSDETQIATTTRTSTKRISSANVTKDDSSSFPTRILYNMETFACFWLDQDINKTNDNQETQNELRKIINHLQIFEKLDECEEIIQKTTHEKIILISSGSLARQIIPRIHDLPQLNACYIFCKDSKTNREWADHFVKVKGVVSKRSELISRVSQDQTVRIRIQDSGTISVVSGNSQSLESRHAMFMWFQLFIEVLLRMHHKLNTRQELVDVCTQHYKNNSGELSIINEFAKTYKKDNSIWWYTRECCLYRILNKALRVQDFDVLFSMRFFITDLSKQLTSEYERYLREMPTRDIIQVYRGQAIGLDELNLIKTSVGQFISMNSFFSTSLQRRTAVSFLDAIESNKDIDKILFEIDIDPRQKTKAFSKIDHLSYFKSEGEILIMLGALFRIESVEQDEKKRFWIAHINLASDDDFYLKQTFAHMKEKIGDETNLNSLGKILTEMGEYRHAQNCYKRLIYESQIDESIGYSGLGWADHWLNQYDESLSNLQKGLSLINEILPDICEEKGRLYSSIGLVYWRKKQYDKALKSLEKAFDIQQQVLSSDHPDLLATYNRFAITYGALNNVDKALEYYNKCLNLRLATLPHDHPDIATSYNNIGWLYNERIGDYEKALECFQKSLAVCRKILPPTHRDIIRTEQNIRKVTEKLQQKDKN